MATLSSSPPQITIEPEHWPEAVIEWYNISGLEDRRESMNRKDLALKAKQHLLSLGWNFWYIDKKTKWELRYTSPINGKNYISLRKACESCIEDGGCGSKYVRPSSCIVDGGCVSKNVRSSIASPVRTKKPSTRQQTQSMKTSESSTKKRKKSEQQQQYESEAATNLMVGERGKMLRLKEIEGKIEVNELLSWLMDNKILIPRTTVFCRGGRRNNVVKEGRILRDGIVCRCCDVFFTLTEFEAHASCTSQTPSTTIFIEDGRSLLDCYKKALSFNTRRGSFYTAIFHQN